MTKQFKIALVVLLVAALALVVGNYYLQLWFYSTILFYWKSKR